MKRPNAHIKANFGQQPFVFDIDGMVKVRHTTGTEYIIDMSQRKREEISDEIAAADVSILHPSLDKASLCKALVAQYLSHDGYNDTAKAFAQEVRREEAGLRAISRDSKFAVDAYLAADDDVDAAHRQGKRPAVSGSPLLTESTDTVRNSFSRPRRLDRQSYQTHRHVLPTSPRRQSSDLLPSEMPQIHRDDEIGIRLSPPIHRQ